MISLMRDGCMKDPLSVARGASYSDSGATALDNIDGDLTSNIVTVNEVDTDVFGTYFVTYDVKDSTGNAADQVTRVVRVVDGKAPVVTTTNSTTADGHYKEGNQISLSVTFDEPVDVTGVPTITLETGDVDANAGYVSGSGTDTLVFSYKIGSGQDSADLDYASTAALDLGPAELSSTASKDTEESAYDITISGNLVNKNKIFNWEIKKNI